MTVEEYIRGIVDKRPGLVPGLFIGSRYKTLVWKALGDGVKRLVVVSPSQFTMMMEAIVEKGGGDGSSIIWFDQVDLLSAREQSMLLKFVEESSLQRILLYYVEDTVFPTVLSRMAFVFKDAAYGREVLESRKSLRSILSHMEERSFLAEEGDGSELFRDGHILENSYYYRFQAGVQPGFSRKVKQRVLKMMGEFVQ